MILVLDTVSINIRTPGIYFDYLGYIGLKENLVNRRQKRTRNKNRLHHRGMESRTDSIKNRKKEER